MSSILIADDEPTLRRYLERFFVGLGHEVRTAANGKEAVAAIEEEQPDLLITDIHMPDMDGFELVRHLKAVGTRLRVIAMSGGAGIDKSQLLGIASAMGAFTTIEKPFELEQLQRLVEEALSE